MSEKKKKKEQEKKPAKKAAKSKSKSKSTSATKPVSKPAVSTNREYETSAAAAVLGDEEPAKEPAKEPVQEPVNEGFDIVAKWKGLDKCVCRFCRLEMIGVEKARKHVYDEHMKPILMRQVRVASPILDANGVPVSKMVFEPVTEENENG